MHRLQRAIWRLRTDEEGAGAVEYVGITVVVLLVVTALTLASTGVGNALGRGADRAVCGALGTCEPPPLASAPLPDAADPASPPTPIVPVAAAGDGVGEAPGVDAFGNPVVTLPDGSRVPVVDGVPTDPATGAPLPVSVDPDTGQPVVTMPDGSTQPLPPDSGISPIVSPPDQPDGGDGPGGGDTPGGGEAPGAGDGPGGGDLPDGGDGPDGSTPGGGDAPGAGQPGADQPGSGQGPTPGDVGDVVAGAPTAGSSGSPEAGAGGGAATPGGASPDMPGANDAVAGDPVNTRTGAFVTRGVDLVLPGPGLPLQLARSYSSTDTRRGMLGRGWTLSYDIGIERGPGRIVVRTETGLRVPFRLDPETNEITAPPGVRSILERTDDGYLLTRPAGQTIRFDGDGRAVALADANGLVTELRYDDQGRLVAVVDAVDRELTLEWGDGVVLGASLPDGTAVRYGYSDGLLVEVVDAAGTTERYAHTDGVVDEVTDNTGTVVVRNTYDDAGRVVEQRDALGHRWQFTYVTEGPYDVTYVTNPMNDRTAHVHSGERLVRTVDALGNVTTLRYDDALDLVEVVDPRGGVTRTARDELGNPTAIILPDGSRSRMTWGPGRTLTQLVNPEGAAWRFTHDDAGNATSATTPDGAETTWAYDAELPGLVSAVTNAAGATLQLEGDDLGRVTAVVGPTGSRVEFAHDEAGNLVGYTEPMGFAEGADPEDHTWTYEWDALQRLVQIVDPLGQTIDIAYDEMSRVTAVTDADGERTVYEYDPIGRLVAVVAPDQSTTRYSWDAEGRVLSRTTPLGEVTQYGYDAVGRLVASLSPAGQRWTWAYDPNGNVTSLTTPEGHATPAPGDGEVTWTYDERNRPVAVQPSDAAAVTATWSPAGRITELVSDGETASFDHDALGRLVDVRLGDEHTTYDYDVVGNLVGRTADGRATAYEYDEGNRLTAVEGPDLQARYAYDLAGRMVEAELGNGARTQAVWDTVGRPTKVTHLDGDGTLVSSSSTTWSADGLPTVVRGLDEVVTHRYDDLDRLVQTTVTARASGTELGQWTYQYDAAGHRVAERDPDGITELAWGPADQLRSVRGPDGATTDVEHDASGRRVAVGDDSFDYDVLDRLVAQTVDGSTTTFEHDPLGHRATATSDAGTTSYRWDPNAVDEQLVELAPDAGEATSFTLLPAAGTLGFSVPDAASYLHSDALGSVTATTTAAGDVGWRHAYTAFGEDRGVEEVTAGAPSSPLRFVGELQDRDSEHYHLRARQLDPSTGTFTSVDPVADLLHRPYAPVYSYVDGTPTAYTDPSGEFFNVVTGAIGAGVGAVVGGGVSLVTQVASGDGVNWGQVGTAALGGAVAGGLAGFTGGASLAVSGVAWATGTATTSTMAVVGGGAVFGAGASMLGNSVTQGLDVALGFGSWNWGDFAVAGVGGALAGGLGAPLNNMLRAPAPMGSGMSEGAAFGLEQGVVSQFSIAFDLTIWGLRNGGDDGAGSGARPTSAAGK